MRLSSIESAASDWIARRDAGLTPSEQADFDQWLSDPRHARALARHEQAWQIFSRPHANGKGPAMMREVHRRIANRRRHRTVVAVAAVSILLVTGLVLRSFMPRESSERIARSNARLVFYEHQKLPDGSMIELNSGAEISVDFSDKFRRVALLKGEALFHVAKNKNRPFIVSVNKVDVRAVGTAFLIQRGDVRVEVLVTEGKVAVNRTTIYSSIGTQSIPSEAIAPLTIATVSTGEHTMVEVSGDTLVARVEAVDPASIADRLAWRAPRLEFTGAPLSDAVAMLNRFNKVKFKVDDPSIAALEVSGYFRVDNANTFLHLIEQGLGVRGERRGDTIILRKAP
jgi:transmembrane sensor